MHDLKVKRLSMLREINRIYRRCSNKLSCCMCRVGFRIASILSLALCFLYIILYSTLEDIMINQGWKRIPSSYKIDYQLSQVGASSDGRISAQNAAYKVDEITLAGAFYMRQSTITFIGTAKDVGNNLPNILHQVDSLSRYFKHSRAIFVDGGSVDDSLSIFTDWANRSNHNRTIFSLRNEDDEEVYLPNFNHSKLPREGRISAARNFALKVYRSMSPPTSLLLVLDLDIVGFRVEGIMDTFGRQIVSDSGGGDHLKVRHQEPGGRGWDVVCSNGILLHGIYRDTYAFRVPGVDNNHHTCGEDHLRYNISKEQKLINRKFYQYSKSRSQSMVRQSKEALLEVDSCFGGMAIYRHEAIENCNYSYRYPFYPYMLDCEHVLFHKCLREKNRARIVVNTRMKLWYGHSSMKHLSLRKELIKMMPLSMQ